VLEESLAIQRRSGEPFSISSTLHNLAEAAIQGKPLDQIALAALPIPAEQKKLVAAGLATAKDLAHGKRLDAALMKNALKSLPADVQKAMTVGMALAHGEVLQAAKAAGQMPAIHAFKGAPVLALGKGSLVTGVEAANRIVAAAKGSDPVAKREAQAIVRNTVAMARTGTPAQRALAGNAVKVLVRTATPQKTGKPGARPAVRKQWQVSSQGRIRRTA
jgi:hypothetical protein